MNGTNHVKKLPASNDLSWRFSDVHNVYPEADHIHSNMNADNQSVLQISLSATHTCWLHAMEQNLLADMIGCPEILENAQTILTVCLYLLFFFYLH